MRWRGGSAVPAAWRQRGGNIVRGVRVPTVHLDQLQACGPGGSYSGQAGWRHQGLLQWRHSTRAVSWSRVKLPASVEKVAGHPIGQEPRGSSDPQPVAEAFDQPALDHGCDTLPLGGAEDVHRQPLP